MRSVPLERRPRVRTMLWLLAAAMTRMAARFGLPFSATVRRRVSGSRMTDRSRGTRRASPVGARARSTRTGVAGAPERTPTGAVLSFSRFARPDDVTVAVSCIDARGEHLTLGGSTPRADVRGPTASIGAARATPLRIQAVFTRPIAPLNGTVVDRGREDAQRGFGRVIKARTQGRQRGERPFRVRRCLRAGRLPSLLFGPDLELTCLRRHRPRPVVETQPALEPREQRKHGDGGRTRDHEAQKRLPLVHPLSKHRVGA